MRILVTAPYNEKGRDILAANLGEVFYEEWKNLGRAYNAEELNALLDKYNADALITEHDNVTAEVIDKHPNLRFIGVCRGTPSNVDLDAAKRHNIPVFHTPARNAQAVAEMFISNVICLMRKVLPGREWLIARNWDKGAHTSYLQFKGTELAGKTIGMVGFGAVGQYIARMVKVFPCNIQFYDPYIKAFDPEYRQTTIEDVFATSDIVSIHLPVTKETVGLINKTLIGKMKPDAIFVNTARASVVNRDDLLYAIENKKIGGAILDVFDNEPPDEKDYRLIDSPLVLATPHIAGATHEVEDHHVEILNEKLLNWINSNSSNSLSSAYYG